MTQMQTVQIPSRAWYGDIEQPLEFPAGWRIHVCAPRDAPALSPQQIRSAFESPIASPRIREAAQGKASAAVVVDDLGRPTPAAELLPLVLDELAAAGVPASETAIVVGGGSHRPLTQEEIVKKVGADVAAAYPVTSHDFMAGDLVGYGSLDDGAPVYINRTVAQADFKICVGGVYPHSAVGFGGGSKLILPGVAGFATMFHFHSFSAARGQGNVEGQPGVRDHRDVSEDVARRIGLDMVVNCVLTSRRQIAGVFVGDFVQAQRAGARFAQKVYATTIPQDLRASADLLVCNAYPLDADPIQGTKAVWARSYFNNNPYTVVYNPASDGVFYHGLFHQLPWRQYLLRKAQAEAAPDPTPVVGQPENLIVVSEHFQASEFPIRHRDGVLFRHWQPLIEQLGDRLPEDAVVALFPCASIQILAREEGEALPSRATPDAAQA